MSVTDGEITNNIFMSYIKNGIVFRFFSHIFCIFRG